MPELPRPPEVEATPGLQIQIGQNDPKTARWAFDGALYADATPPH